MVYRYEQIAPVVFGAGALATLGEEVKALGCKKVMCVYDGGVKVAGIAEKAESSLKEAGIEYIVYDKITPDPPSATVDEAAAIAREAKIDGIVGVGGGSSMDATKTIALLTDRPGSIRDYLKDPPIWLTSSIPIILVPTTSGTGSEVTQACIVSHEELNLKLAVFTRATLALVDPELVKTLPPEGTAITGFDALAHAVESVTSNGWNPRSELLALTAITKIKKYLLRAVKDGSDMEARTELALASNWAGTAFSDTNVHVGHGAADAFSAAFHTPHGLNCAWTTPVTIELVAPVVPEKVKLIGEAIGVEFGAGDSPEVIGKKTADALRSFMKECGLQSPTEMGLDRQKTIDSANVIMGGGLRFFCPVEITDDISTWIMTQAYDTYV